MKKRRKRICPKHNTKLVYFNSKYGPLWKCATEDCTVLQWGGDTSTPADQETRALRKRCHDLFDPLWHGTNRRGKFYYWLARRLDLPIKKMHFGMLDADQCRQVIDALEAYQVIYIRNGPAKGKLLGVSRTPALLRICISEDGIATALDDLGMSPRPKEECYCYIVVERVDDDPGGTTAVYELFDHQPKPIEFIESQRWQRWAMAMWEDPAAPPQIKTALDAPPKRR